VYEVGISYSGRTYEEGKKIGWKDGMRALWCLAKYALKKPRSAASVAVHEPASFSVQANEGRRDVSPNLH
jgi:hypothetical protein